ncbi:hypothetical protein BUALT_Bualt05G0069100 [Buddleja alternifolia]|uniref:DUF7054 domain-containing protein n=1 Tax=Buddleja alternifolia TaxID=168488 RepID=A0AAV6XIR1_9LAMI|nr:hypothetical protein BUALT_Bualt05G0069100 [Buddleja alternifolia]
MDSLSSSKGQENGNGSESRRRYGGLMGKLASISGGGGGGGGGKRPQLTKLLINVNIQNSLGPIQVVMSPEKTVAELTTAAISIYVKEKRRPLLRSNDPGCFELHYSQFSLESLRPEEKLIDLGSRNFFLCPKPANAVN